MGSAESGAPWRGSDERTLTKAPKRANVAGARSGELQQTLRVPKSTSILPMSCPYSESPTGSREFNPQASTIVKGYQSGYFVDALLESHA